MGDWHSTTEHLTLLCSYPEHEPRASDPHYHLFNAARDRLARQGLLTCWIGNADCDKSHPIELHHNVVEFSLANDVDVAKFAHLYPDLLPECSDDAFATFVEGEGNLLPLCKMHHTGILGVHVIHYPAWVVQRFMKDGVVPPERKVVP